MCMAISMAPPRWPHRVLRDLLRELWLMQAALQSLADDGSIGILDIDVQGCKHASLEHTTECLRYGA